MTNPTATAIEVELNGPRPDQYDPAVLAKLAQARTLENGALLTLAEIETLLEAAAKAARARSLDGSPVGAALRAALAAVDSQRTTVDAAANRTAAEAVQAGRMLGLRTPAGYGDWRLAVAEP